MRVATVNGYRLDFSQYPRLESYEAAYVQVVTRHTRQDNRVQEPGQSRADRHSHPGLRRGAGAGGPRGLVRKAARFIPFNSKRRNRFIAYDQNTTHWGRGSWYMDMSMLEPELNWN